MTTIKLPLVVASGEPNIDGSGVLTVEGVSAEVRDDFGVSPVVDATAEKVKLVGVDEHEEAAEVVRPSVTMIVGDLNGCHQTYLDAIKSLQVVGDDGRWIGGDKRVIFVGDILGDRTAEGLKILDDIHSLKEQAKVNKGSVKVIFGNHEDFVVSFLAERRPAGAGEERSPLEALFVCSIHKWQGLGVVEFISRFSEYGKSFKGDLHALSTDISLQMSKADGLAMLNKLSGEVRKTMLEQESGRKILEDICSMKLVIVDGDTVIFYTEPTEGILRELTNGVDIRQTVEKLNAEFQAGLRAFLFNEDGKPSNGRFGIICSTFLDTDKNRGFRYKMSKPEIVEELAILEKMGIRCIVHGHSTVYSMMDAVYEAGGITVVNVDLGAGKSGVDENLRSVAALGRKEGQLAVGRGAVERLMRLK